MKKNSPTEKPATGSKGKVGFQKAWKAVKSTFPCRDPNRVVRLDLDDPELMPVPRPVRNKPMADTNPVHHEMMMCLPGQICEDPESLCVPGPSRIRPTPDTNPVYELPSVSNPSSCDLDDKKAKKGRKRKAAHAFFQRLRKAVKHPFLCCDSDNVQHLPPQPEIKSVELQNEKHTKVRKVPAVLQTMWTNIKHSIQSPKTKVCPFVPKHPDTSIFEQKDYLLDEFRQIPGYESFFNCYEVEDRVKWERHEVYKAIRKSDGKRIIITLEKKQRSHHAYISYET